MSRTRRATTLDAGLPRGRDPRAFVVALTPLLVWFFASLTSAGRKITTARKIFWGMSLTTTSLLLMALAGMFTVGGTAKVSGMWLVGFYLIVTMGELMLSPMGLSLVTKLAPGPVV